MVRLPGPMRPLFPYLKPVYTVATRCVAPLTVRLSARADSALPRGAFATMEDAATASGGRCVQVAAATVVIRTPPAPSTPCLEVFSKSLIETVPRTAVAELPGGRVLGAHRAVITGTGDLVQDVTHYFGTSRPREHPMFLRPFPPAPMDFEGRLGVLALRGDMNYYHFLMDVLPRLAVQEACSAIAVPDVWYVPAATTFQRELLDRVGVTSDRRIDSNQHPHVRAQTLVVPTPPSMAVVNPPWVVEHLRSVLLDGAYARVAGRGLYVTRGRSANNRGVINEDAVVETLAARGFDLLDPADVAVEEQIAAFAQASVIVASHGAALANLVFASPGSTVIELFPAGCPVPDYWKLSCAVPGLNYRALVGEGTSRRHGRSRMLVRDITVNVDELARLVDSCEP